MMQQHKLGAGTDLLGVRDFFDAARRYRQRVIDYFYDEEVFRSRPVVFFGQKVSQTGAIYQSSLFKGSM